MNIALTGHLRSGKSSAAAYLRDKYGYTEFAFGDGIREVTRRLYPESYASGAKPRALLQGFGQMARTFDNDVWVNDCFRRIAEAGDDYEVGYGYRKRKIAISDLRQPNELEACKRLGYVIIRIKSQSALRIQRATVAGDTFDPATLTHETESHVDGFVCDYEVFNDGTLAELYAQIDAILAR